METESRLVTARSQEKGRGGNDCYGYRVSFEDDENIPELESCDGCTTL